MPIIILSLVPTSGTISNINTKNQITCEHLMFNYSTTKNCTFGNKRIRSHSKINSELLLADRFCDILALHLHVAASGLMVSSSVTFDHLKVTTSVRVDMYSSLSLMLDIKNEAGVTVCRFDI